MAEVGKRQIDREITFPCGGSFVTLYFDEDGRYEGRKVIHPGLVDAEPHGYPWTPECQRCEFEDTWPGCPRICSSGLGQGERVKR